MARVKASVKNDHIMMTDACMSYISVLLKMGIKKDMFHDYREISMNIALIMHDEDGNTNK